MGPSTSTPPCAPCAIQALAEEIDEVIRDVVDMIMAYEQGVKPGTEPGATKTATATAKSPAAPGAHEEKLLLEHETAVEETLGSLSVKDFDAVD